MTYKRLYIYLITFLLVCGQLLSMLSVSAIEGEDEVEEGEGEIVGDPLRPEAHFVPDTAIPTRLCATVYDPSNRSWHMFYNPEVLPEGDAAPCWMHAVSYDLIHWEELGVAIERNELGYPYVSGGSVVVDEDNTSGFFDKNRPDESKLVAIFTRHGETLEHGTQKQCIAYSKDHGVTWIEPTMEQDGVENPILSNLLNFYGELFSAPTVVRYENTWLMIVSGVRTRIFVSDDLKNWIYSSEISTGNASFSFFPLAVDGDESNLRWVRLLSGSSYEVGVLTKFPQTGQYIFVPDGKLKTLRFGSSMITCTFPGMDGGYGSRIAISNLFDPVREWYPGSTWNGAMTLPYELRLITDKEASDSLVLTMSPLEETKTLRGTKMVDLTAPHGATAKEALRAASGRALDMEITFTPKKDSGIFLGFRQGDSFGMSLEYYESNGQLLVKNLASNVADAIMYCTKDENEQMTLRVILDNSLLEVFDGSGRAVYAGVFAPPEDAIGLDLELYGDVTIDLLEVWRLKSMAGQEILPKPGLYFVEEPTFVGVSVDAFVLDEEGNYSEAVTFADVEHEKCRVLDVREGHIDLQALGIGDVTLTASAGSYTREITVSMKTLNFASNLKKWTNKGGWSSSQGYGNSFKCNINDFSFSQVENTGSFAYSVEVRNLGYPDCAGMVFGVSNPVDPDQGIWYGAMREERLDGSYIRLFVCEQGEIGWEQTMKIPVEYSGECDLTLTYQAKNRMLTLSGSKDSVSISIMVRELPTGRVGLGIMQGSADVRFAKVQYTDQSVGDPPKVEEDPDVTEPNAPITEPLENDPMQGQEPGETQKPNDDLILTAIIALVGSVVVLCIVSTVVWKKRRREMAQMLPSAQNKTIPKGDDKLPPRLH